MKQVYRSAYAGVLPILFLGACADGPPTCHDRLVGLWTTTEVVPDIREPDGTDKTLNFVRIVELKDNRAARYLVIRYEEAGTPGKEAPRTPPVIAQLDVWQAGPPADPAHADCSLGLGWEKTDSETRWDRLRRDPDARPPEDSLEFHHGDVVFDGPDSFTDKETDLIYRRIAPEDVKP